MAHSDQYTMCCIIPCEKKAEFGFLEDGDLYEWNYVCASHLADASGDIRPIERCPPFCDELTAKLPNQAGDEGAE